MEKLMPVKTGDLILLKIEGLGSGGEGVGRYENFTVFVKGALPGEKVEAVITLVKKSYAQGRLEKIVTESAERVEPLCPVYAECGGCQLQHLSYPGQLRAKRQQVEDALRRIGRTDAAVLPAIGAASPFNYRNKMQLPASGVGETLAIGCYAALTHRVIATDRCLIQKEANNQVLEVVRRWMRRFDISAYDEKTGKGLVRHVMARVGAASGEVMAVLVASGYDLPHRKELIERLIKFVPGLTSVILNINKKPGNVVMGPKSRLLWGREAITERLGHLSFNISAQSFFQVNSEQAQKLYNKAIEYASLTGKETVVDVYCGTGTISLYAARHALKVYGVEIVAAAVEDARVNAQKNGCLNVEFISGDAAEALKALFASGVRPDVAFLDPPRAGCEEKVLAALAAAGPRRVVYVSCNPASLARDVERLAQLGYDAAIAQPVDMFPMTMHIETVCLLSKRA